MLHVRRLKTARMTKGKCGLIRLAWCIYVFVIYSDVWCGMEWLILMESGSISGEAFDFLFFLLWGSSGKSVCLCEPSFFICVTIYRGMKRSAAVNSNSMLTLIQAALVTNS